MTTHGATSPSRTVLAAGGVVLTGPPASRRVLVVHRPRYDDWSLPKGHVDDGEDLRTTAAREVTEETGVVATVEREAGTTEHLVTLPDGPARKLVHWFVMRPDVTAGDPVARAAARPADGEVDRAEWWPVERALQELTHDGDRTLVRRAAGAA